ncbi:C39 family peptidase, partial [Chloroflexota bacterium]
TPKGFFLGSVLTAIQNQGYEYTVAALKGGQITSEFFAGDLPKKAKEVFLPEGEGDAMQRLQKTISSGTPVMVHLDLAPIKGPMSEHTSWAGNAFMSMTHIDHFMTVTGYDYINIYLNDPSEKAPGKGKDIPVDIAGFMEAWKNGNHQSFDMESRVGPCWMLYLGNKGQAKTVDELLTWNKVIASKAPEEIRKAADNPNIMELIHSNEMYRARKEFAAFLEANGHQEAGRIFLQVADILKKLNNSSNKKADLLKMAELQQEAVEKW